MRGTVGSGDVGAWHETYQVPAAELETVDSDMPPFGLAAATRRVPIGRGAQAARQRMRRGQPQLREVPALRDRPSVTGPP